MKFQKIKRVQHTHPANNHIAISISHHLEYTPGIELR